MYETFVLKNLNDQAVFQCKLWSYKQDTGLVILY